MSKRQRRGRSTRPRTTTKHRRRPAKAAALSHFNAEGQARMVQVGAKPVTARRAVAEGAIHMQRHTLDLILKGGHKKGDVLGIARIAAIQAAKKTPELVPLCHPIALDAVEIELTPAADAVAIHCRAVVSATARTGVEMEALAAVQIALLTIYDMCKAVDRGMTLTDIRLLEKSGGRSGTWRRK